MKQLIPHSGFQTPVGPWHIPKMTTDPQATKISSTGGSSSFWGPTSPLTALLSPQSAQVSPPNLLELGNAWEDNVCGGKGTQYGILPQSPPFKSAISSRGTDLCSLESSWNSRILGPHLETGNLPHTRRLCIQCSHERNKQLQVGGHPCFFKSCTLGWRLQI